MKKYIAIGHFSDSKNIVSVAMKASTKQSFAQDLIGNQFVAYAILTEKKMETFKCLDDFAFWDEVKKLTTNYRRWNDIADYIGQCYDIMEERMAGAC